MNYQSTKKGKCDFPFFFIFNDLLVIENGSTSLCCGNSELIRVSLGFFPAFLDLSSVTLADTGIIIVIATLAVGGAKLVYACMADRASRLLSSSSATKMINIVAGTVMVGVGTVTWVHALQRHVN